MSGEPKLIFRSSIESMLDVANGRVSAPTVARLAELRLVRHHLEPAYPAEHWARAVKIISADLYPGKPEEDQHRQLGRETVLHFAHGVMGKAMFAVAKVLGARRSMIRMTNNLKTGANFIQTRYTIIDDHHQELWMNDVSDVPGFYMGLLGAGADYVDGWFQEIHVKARVGPDCLFELRRT
jgi:uncharacterized protein (TIGR02265 family)